MKLNTSMKITKEESKRNPYGTIPIGILVLIAGQMIVLRSLPLVIKAASRHADIGLIILTGEYATFISLSMFPVMLLLLLIISKTYYKRSLKSLGFFPKGRFTSDAAKHIFNGGVFGLEGGLIATIVGVTICALLLLLCRKKNLI